MVAMSTCMYVLSMALRPRGGDHDARCDFGCALGPWVRYSCLERSDHRAAHLCVQSRLPTNKAAAERNYIARHCQQAAARGASQTKNEAGVMSRMSAQPSRMETGSAIGCMIVSCSGMCVIPLASLLLDLCLGSPLAGQAKRISSRTSAVRIRMATAYTWPCGCAQQRTSLIVGACRCKLCNLAQAGELARQSPSPMPARGATVALNLTYGGADGRCVRPRDGKVHNWLAVLPNKRTDPDLALRWTRSRGVNECALHLSFRAVLPSVCEHVCVCVQLCSPVGVCTHIGVRMQRAHDMPPVWPKALHRTSGLVYVFFPCLPLAVILRLSKLCIVVDGCFGFVRSGWFAGMCMQCGAYRYLISVCLGQLRVRRAVLVLASKSRACVATSCIGHPLQEHRLSWGGFVQRYCALPPFQ